MTARYITVKGSNTIALVNDMGVETKAEISYSDLRNVKAALAEALPTGDYTLAVYTRSGMGGEFGVKKVTRKVTVGQGKEKRP